MSKQKAKSTDDDSLLRAVMIDVDFSALLRESVDSEGQCTEVLPGTLLQESAAVDLVLTVFLSILGAVHPEQAQASGKSRPPPPISLEDTQPTKRPKAGNVSPEAPPKKNSRQNRKQSRVRSEAIIRNGYRASSFSTQKYLSAANPIKTDLDTPKLPAARGAYTALNKPSPPKKNASVEELMAEGFQYIAVDPKDK